MNSAPYPSPESGIDYAAALAEAERRIQVLTADQERARRVDQMVEHITDRLCEGLILLDAAGSIVMATRSFGRLLGLGEDSAAWHGRSVAYLMAQVQPLLAAPLDLASWAAPHSQKLKIAQYELFRLRSGQVLACEIVPAPAGAGADGITLMTLRDVSEQQRLLTDVKLTSRISEQNPSPIVRIGANRQQLYANPAARLASRDLSRTDQVQVQQQLRTAAATALAQAAPCQVEMAMGERAYTVSVVPFPQEGYVNLYFADITERDAVRLQLREQQQFMQQVLDTIPSMVYVRDADQKLVFQNRAMEVLVAAATNIQPTDVPVPSSVADQERASYAEADIRVLATGEEVTTENQLTLPNELVNWFYTIKRPLHYPDGTMHVLGVSTDITALKETQQTLERGEKQYRDLMTYSQALIGTGDMAGNVLTVNPALAKLLREDEAAMPGMPVTTHMLPEDQDSFAAYLVRIAAKGEDEGVLRVRPRGSDELHYLLYHNFVVREEGHAPYIISHAHDITDRVLASKVMKRAKLTAEAAVTARENFLANMSHEIRTPMNGVLGVANLLAKTPLTAEQQEYLRIIRSSGQHLLVVLNDVLDMAKIASGKLEMNLEAFNLCDSLSQTIQPLAMQAIEKGIRFEGRPLRATCPFPWVLADAHRLNQIMINLVGNAIKFTPANGLVREESTLLAETAETLTIEFKVTDTGIGMPPEVLARIFESFTQAYAGTARHFGGTGLGLSISRALVEQMGGRLTVESTAGVGSCFSFVLTLAKATAAAEDLKPETFDTGALRGVRALLVEDNDINRFVARRTMQEWGVVVTEAEDGHLGVDKFEQDTYDVVLMDIQMPGMSGLEATALLRAHADAARARTPILALTANAFRADHEKYLAAGMDDCLAKPFDEATLYTKLSKLLRR
jgi:PAS domain S-box-containing protein